ncbi:DUF3012 domain-containing protein [Algiphilus sp.]|uniref:DUF3012 domain-containing protein n=1 Tax=Algiphilus sp. TaxID=1872431 RepID=UPI003B51E424
MKSVKPYLSGGVVAIAFALSACSPEVGSKAWCQDMDEEPKGDWSANEATAYARNCIFKSEDE